MNRKLKALGLALIAVLAMGGLSASSASAGEFHSEAAHTMLKGSQVGADKFTVNAGTVSCNEATYGGTLSAATTRVITAIPTYTQCTAFGFVNATIDVNGCTYEYSGENSNTVIGCAGSPITVTAFNCYVKVGSQTLGGITYTNTGSGTSRDLDASVNVIGMKYTQESKSFPGCSNGTFTNGTFTGAQTLQGFNTAGAQVGIWRS